MSTPEKDLMDAIEHVLLIADDLGLNVEIRHVPLQPLAMGHTKPAVHIWPKRSVVNKIAEVAS